MPLRTPACPTIDAYAAAATRGAEACTCVMIVCTEGGRTWHSTPGKKMERVKRERANEEDRDRQTDGWIDDRSTERRTKRKVRPDLDAAEGGEESHEIGRRKLAFARRRGGGRAPLPCPRVLAHAPVQKQQQGGAAAVERRQVRQKRDAARARANSAAAVVAAGAARAIRAGKECRERTKAEHRHDIARLRARVAERELLLLLMLQQSHLLLLLLLLLLLRKLSAVARATAQGRRRCG